MKRGLLRRTLVMVIAFVSVFAFTATALAFTLVDSASWDSNVCLNGFTTTGAVHKDAEPIWNNIKVKVTKLSFASTPDNNYLYATPKYPDGTVMGSQEDFTLGNEEDIWIHEEFRDNFNTIKLRIDNPNEGNNMKSGGTWKGYVE